MRPSSVSSFSSFFSSSVRGVSGGGACGNVARASVLASLMFLFPSSASAYCTLHTCKDVTQSQAEASKGKLEPKLCERNENRCIIEGEELFWRSPCLSYGVSALNTSVLGLTPDEFDALVEDAFKVWRWVECPGGGNPRFEVSSVGVVDSNGNFFCEDEPMANISVWSLVTRWPREPSALGYTSSTHNKRNGEIFDADVELNLNKIKAEYPGNYATVLGRIAVHEAGHYLGLGHTNDMRAVMYDSYNSYDLLTKELNQDDIEGICKLYPPGGELNCSEPGYVEAALNQQACTDAALANDEADETVGCSIKRVGESGVRKVGLLGFALFLMGVVARRKRLY